MQLIEFKISSDNIGIETSSKRYFDLHNDFELLNFHYEFEERYFEIIWKKGSGDWVKINDPIRLKMKFNNVQILRLKEIDQVKEQLTEFPEDDIKISSIGYTTKDDIQFLGYLAEINPDIEDYAISIYSENGQALIIYCDTVELELQGN